MKKILAIDPGFDRIGIAVLEGTGSLPILLYSSCFKTLRTDAFSSRLLALGNEIEKVIREWKPDALALETLLFTKNQKTGMQVAEARGAILLKAKEAGLSIYEYGPLQVKVAVAGYGKATKEQVAHMLPRLIALSKPVSSDDEMDAIALGITCLASSGHLIHK